MTSIHSKMDGWNGCTQMDGWMDEHILGHTCMYGIDWMVYADGHMYVDLCMHVCKNAWAYACVMYMCMYVCMYVL